MSVCGEMVSDGRPIKDMPNLKVEIENDLDQKMETDDDDESSVSKAPVVSSETEEGEVVDDDDRLGESGGVKTSRPSSVPAPDSLTVPVGRSILKYDTKEYVELQELQQHRSVPNPNGAFVTGVDIFSPEEQAKLEKRAKRFGINATEGKVLTEKLLKKLYKSMCVKPGDENLRLEALHMRGTQEMSTRDVFDYFKDYGPASLEWLTDNTCNVVWLDSISAARALLGLSVHISGQLSSNRRQSLSDASDVDMESQKVKSVNSADNLSEESDAVALDDLDAPLTNGPWRRGAPHPLSPCILLRFARTSDRSVPGFKKFGNHESGGYVGLISESRKRRLQNTVPAPILFDDVGDEIIPKPALDKTDTANPWGILAKTWSQFDRVRQPRPPSPLIERILPLPPRMTPPPSPPMFISRSKLSSRPRLRRGRDEGGVVIRRVSDPGSDSSDNEEWCTRSKVPRMRMHADDEEKRRDKKLKRSRRHRSMSSSPPKDLRKKIAVQKKNSEVKDSSEPEPIVEEPEDDDEIPDLRVAVAADKSPSPEDTKVGIRQTLFQSGNVKSVLRGARGHSENGGDDEEDDSEDTEKVKTKRHRSRSKERRKHHRKHKKESSYHKSRRRESESESDEKPERTLKSTVKSAIRRKSPEVKERHNTERRERRSPHESRERRSPRHERRRRHEHEDHSKSDARRKLDSRRHYSDGRSGGDLRSKLAHKNKSYESNNEFRSKSPLQIEIDNDEYYRQTESE